MKNKLEIESPAAMTAGVKVGSPSKIAAHKLSLEELKKCANYRCTRDDRHSPDCTFARK